MESGDRRISLIAIILLGVLIGAFRLSGLTLPKIFKDPRVETAKSFGRDWKESETETLEVTERLTKYRTNSFFKVAAYSTSPFDEVSPVSNPTQADMIEAFYDLARVEKVFIFPESKIKQSRGIAITSVMMATHFELTDVIGLLQVGDYTGASKKLARISAVANRLIESPVPEYFAWGLSIKELQQHCLAQLLQSRMDDQEARDFVAEEMKQTTYLEGIDWDGLIDYDVMQQEFNYDQVRDKKTQISPSEYRKKANEMRSHYNALDLTNVHTLLYMEERIDFSGVAFGSRKRVLWPYTVCKSIAALQARRALVEDCLFVLLQRTPSGDWPEKIELPTQLLKISYKRNENGVEFDTGYVKMRPSESLLSMLNHYLPQSINGCEPLSLTLYDEPWIKTVQRRYYVSPLCPGDGAFNDTK